MVATLRKIGRSAALHCYCELLGLYERNNNYLSWLKLHLYLWASNDSRCKQGSFPKQLQKVDPCNGDVLCFV